MPRKIMHGNLFAALPGFTSAASEEFSLLMRSGDMRLERIVSLGHATPPGDWYDQAENEWVLLVAGNATLQIEGEPVARQLAAGDYLLLPAHCRHRVEATALGEPTIWLALHFTGELGFSGETG